MINPKNTVQSGKKSKRHVMFRNKPKQDREEYKLQALLSLSLNKESGLPSYCNSSSEEHDCLCQILQQHFTRDRSSGLADSVIHRPMLLTRLRIRRLAEPIEIQGNMKGDESIKFTYFSEFQDLLTSVSMSLLRLAPGPSTAFTPVVPLRISFAMIWRWFSLASGMRRMTDLFSYIVSPALNGTTCCTRPPLLCL